MQIPTCRHLGARFHVHLHHCADAAPDDSPNDAIHASSVSVRVTKVKKHRDSCTTSKNKSVHITNILPTTEL